MLTLKDITSAQDEWNNEEDREFAHCLLRLPDSETVTVVKNFAKKNGFDYSYARDCFRNLAENNFGKYIKGSRGSDSRIAWGFPPREIAETVLGESNDLMALAAENGPEKKFPNKDDFVGKKKWEWQDVRRILAHLSEVEPAEIVLNMNVKEVRKNFSLLHGIDEKEISFSVGI